MMPCTLIFTIFTTVLIMSMVLITEQILGFGRHAYLPLLANFAENLVNKLETI